MSWKNDLLSIKNHIVTESSYAGDVEPSIEPKENILDDVSISKISMDIDFGIVKKYFSDRGFGFITHTLLSGHQSEVFFHIKNVKRTRPDLAEKLDNEESVDTIYFWYETENTSNGEQVCNVLQSDVIQNVVTGNFPSFVDKVEKIWRDIDSVPPVWLYDITVDLVGSERASELNLDRNNLEKEKRELEAKKQKEREALRIKEEMKRQKLLEERKIQEEAEEKEFEQLVAEMKPYGFTESRNVSLYIKNNMLGYKYKNISGIVKMEQHGNSWDFEGGFPPNIYARLCEKLELNNQGTRARAVGFKPFKSL